MGTSVSLAAEAPLWAGAVAALSALVYGNIVPAANASSPIPTFAAAATNVVVV